MLKILATLFLFFLLLLAWAQPRGEAGPITLEEYRTNGVTVVHGLEAQPLYFLGEDGQPMGVLVDYWEMWSKKTGIPVTFLIAPWKETLRMVATDEADINAGLAKTTERLEFLDYSEPFLPITLVLLVEGKNKIDNEIIYANHTIGVVSKTQPESFIRKEYPQATMKAYATPGAVVAALAKNEVDAAAMDVASFQFNNAKLERPIKFSVCDVISEEHLHAGVRKGNTALLTIVDDGFSAISADEYQRLKNRWYISEQSTLHWPGPLAWFGVGALILGVIMYLIFQSRSFFPHKRKQLGE